MRVPIVLALLALFAASTHSMTAVWQTEPAVWARVLALSPDRPRALVNMGNSRVTAHDFLGAHIYYYRAIEAADLPSTPPWNAYIRAEALRNLRTVDTLLAH